MKIIINNKKIRIMTTNLITTALPLVYRKENEFEVLNGLDLNRKDELWGIQLPSGIMLALKCDPDAKVKGTSWYELKAFAEEMQFKGKSGSLPSYGEMVKEIESVNRYIRLSDTRSVLKDNGIESDGFKGIVWCNDSNYSDFRYRVNLAAQRYDWEYPGCRCANCREIISFN